ncbi:MAG TPA: GNAT family N-acetyltransferase, partial [Niastella sp.]|nr:GNAT family N-acetyltransferase [Niastella sp.]
MSEIIIKEATAADAALIAELSRKTFYDAFAGDNTKANMDKFLNETFTREKLIEEVGVPGNIFLLAYDGDEAVGYVRMRDTVDPELFQEEVAIEVARIYAMQTSIGKGVGSALMQQCIDIARHKSAKVIWLGVWEKNDRAISFYKKWGFEPFGNHVFM